VNEFKFKRGNKNVGISVFSHDASMCVNEVRKPSSHVIVLRGAKMQKCESRYSTCEVLQNSNSALTQNFKSVENNIILSSNNNMKRSSSQRTVESTSHEHDGKGKNREREPSGDEEKPSCWDRLVARLLPSETDYQRPLIRDIKWQHRMIAVIFVLSWISFFFGLVSVSGCDFIRMGKSDAAYGSLESLGLFRVPYHSEHDNSFLGCIAYDSAAEWDRGFRNSRAMALLGMLCLSGIVFFITPAILFITNKGMRIVFYWLARFLVLPALFFNCMVFIMFGRDECGEGATKCPPGSAGILAMINVFIIAILAVLLFVTGCPTNPALGVYSDPNAQEQRQRQSKVEKDIEQPPEQPKPPTELRRSKQTKPSGEQSSSSALVVVPALGANDNRIDMRVEKIPGGEDLKVSQRFIHVDGTKTVKTYVKKQPRTDAMPDEILVY
jgi:hypothetical protein